MKAGVAKKNITPPVGVDLSGYAGRPGPSAGINDDLYARALVLEEDGAWAAILSLDVLALTAEQVDRIRGCASKLCRVPGENIMIACSHTHAGPATVPLRRCGTPDLEYVERLVALSAETIALAASGMLPVSVSAASACCDLGMNRRLRTDDGRVLLAPNPEGPVDPEVSVIFFEFEDSTALIFNYACHGVCLGADNVLISADWMGAAAARIEEKIDGPALFLQGCAGNINPRLRGSPEEMVEAGEMVAGAVLAASEHALPRANIRIRVANRRFVLPLQPLPLRDELKTIEERLAESLDQAVEGGASARGVELLRAELDWCREALKARREMPQGIKIRIQAIGIGPVTIVALPAEPFVEIGLRIKSLRENVMAAGCANGNVGYIPTAAAFSEGGYEVESGYKVYSLQMISPESERLVVENALAAIAECSRS